MPTILPLIRGITANSASLGQRRTVQRVGPPPGASLLPLLHSGQTSGGPAAPAHLGERAGGVGPLGTSGGSRCRGLRWPDGPGPVGPRRVPKKMGNVGPGMLGSMLFLILGLQPLPLSRGRFLHQPPNSRSFQLGTRHHKSSWEKLKSCKGAFDLYFVVDASQKANNIWKDINKLVDEMVKKYTNPDLRMSFITSSTQGRTVMKLTSDRQEIRHGLSRLQNIVPTGATNLQEGLIKANKQIQHATSGESSASSLIITLTAGPLLPRTLQDTKKEAQQARDMGAKVYCLGIQDYKRDQLHNIVERKDQMYGMDKFNSAEKLVASLVKNSCMEMMAGDTHFVCLGEAYKVTFSVSGLHQKRKDEIVCRYHLGPRKVYGKRPISINNEKLICPGHMFDKAGQEVFIDYSLNNGVTFVDEDLKVAGKDCGNDRVGPQGPQWTGGRMEEHKTWQEEVKPSEPTVVSTMITPPTVIMIRTIVPTVVLTTTVPTVATTTRTVPTTVTTTSVSTTVTTASTVPTTITRTTTASTFVPEEEMAVPEVVPEDETAFPQAVTEEETTFPEVLPEENTFPQAVPEEETTFPEVFPEEENTFPQAVPEEETTFPEVFPEEENTFPQAVPEEETTFPEVFPEEENTFPQAVPEEETTFPELFPEDKTTFPEVVPEDETTFPEVVPEEETTFPRRFPGNETTFPQVFRENEATFPEVSSEDETTFPEVIPEDEATFPEMIPEEEATFPEVIPEGEIIFTEAFPRKETTVPTTVSEETTAPTVVPEEETTMPNISPEEETAVPTSVTEETTAPTVVPEEETTMSNISPEEETTVPTIVAEETMASTVVPEEETTMSNIFPEEETTVPTSVTEETMAPTVVPEEEATMSNISPEEETTVPTSVTEETTAPTVVPEEETTMPNISPEEETTLPTTVIEETTTPTVVPEEETAIPEFFPEGEIIIRGTVPKKISLMPKVVSRNLLYRNPLWVPVLISALFLSLLLSLLVCICCHKWVFKKPSPAQKAEKKPCPEQGYTTVIIPCCECQEDRIRQMEGKLDVFYNFLQRCSLEPLMRCPSRDMGRCLNFTLVNPHCAQMLCGSNICLQPSQECFPLNINCSDHQYPPPICPQPPSKILPLIPPTARKLCRSSMSLPPP
ncbi:hypothetical protein R6Z07F_019343 [Ovis aries]